MNKEQIRHLKLCDLYNVPDTTFPEGIQALVDARVKKNIRDAKRSYL